MTEPRRILVVDDDLTTAAILARVLRTEGYEVQVCADGEAALEQLSKADFHVLLTDQVMPGISGLELARRARERDPALRCIVISGQAPPAGELDIETWLEKPLNLAVVLGAVSGGGARPEH